MAGALKRRIGPGPRESLAVAALAVGFGAAGAMLSRRRLAGPLRRPRPGRAGPGQGAR